MDLALQLASARLRRRAVGEVQVGLVQAGDLDPVAEPAQDVHHLARGPPIQPDVAGDQDRLRAAPVGDRQRQSRVNAVAAGFVGGGHHDAAGGGIRPGRDHDRLSSQVGPAHQLDGDEERVHVHMGDAVGPLAHGGGTLARG